MKAWYIQRFDSQADLPIAQIEVDIFEIEIVKGRREKAVLRGQIGSDGQD